MNMAGRALRALMPAPIVAYQRYISPALGPWRRYAPSCSTYALRAIRVHEPIKGLIPGTWRLLRCNPQSYRGVDHVSERGRWKPDSWIPPEDWAGHDNWVRPDPMRLDPEHSLTGPDTASGL